MLRTVNPSKNLLTLEGVIEENKMVDGDGSSQINLFKSEKVKNLIILLNIKFMGFLTFKVGIVFT